MEEAKSLALIRKTTNFEYQPPQPSGHWSSLGSEKEIEGTWVRDTRTRVRRGTLLLHTGIDDRECLYFTYLHNCFLLQLPAA